MEVNQEALDQVQTTVLVCLTQRLDISEDSIAFESDVKELSNGNIYLFGHALFDIHEFLGIKVHYAPLSEFDEFQTVEDLVRYFYSRMLDKEEE